MKRTCRAFFTTACVVAFGAIILLSMDKWLGATTWPGTRYPTQNSSAHTFVAPEATQVPRIVLWAWERPEDLRFLDAQKIGVAFLAGTIELRSVPRTDNAVGNGVALRPRRQPLRVSQGTPLMAVVRIESSNDLWHRPVTNGSRAHSAAPLYSDGQRERIVSIAAEAAQLPGVKALQIDFDATQSERAFYAAVLEDLRARLPGGIPLSITALASWCMGDPWLASLPPGTIDEAVPMLFRMGPDAQSVISYMKSGKEFPPPVCRRSLGLSTDEAFSQSLLDGTIQPHGSGRDAKRIYVFTNHAWTAETVTNVSEEVEK